MEQWTSLAEKKPKENQVVWGYDYNCEEVVQAIWFGDYDDEETGGLPLLQVSNADGDDGYDRVFSHWLPCDVPLPPSAAEMEEFKLSIKSLVRK